MGRLRRAIGKANNALTRLKIVVESRLGILDDIVIQPFPSWGTPKVLHVHGRVIESKGLMEPGDGASIITGVLNTVSRMESDEIPDATVRLEAEGEALEITTDSEGFFTVDVPSEEALAPGWHKVSVELVRSIAGDHHATAEAEVLVPHPDAQYTVISDLDDTVVVTGATDTLRMIRLVATKHAKERSLFPGVGALYRALRAGTAGHPDNAIFYVTRSGWNLADLFLEIFEERGIPKGPILMRDFANIEPQSESFTGRRSKLDWFEHLFEELPHEFVLIGDSGQHDPENYLECVTRWPGRVAAVFIRDVTTPERDQEVRRIADEILSRGVKVSVSDSTVEFARDAIRFGLIEPQALGAVERDSEKERSAE